MKKIKYLSKLLESRFGGLQKEVRNLFIISLLSIFFIELIFNKINAKYKFQYHIGLIYLKLCYSYLSAFIFYYLVVYAPKERRRVKSFRYLNNKLLMIGDQISDLLVTLFKPQTQSILKGNILTLPGVKEFCKNINPKLPIAKIENGNASFSTCHEYLNFQTHKIKLLTKELLALNDIVNEELFRGLTNINVLISDFLNFNINIYANKEIEYLSYPLYNLYIEKEETLQIFLHKYQKRYDFLYHYFERQRNLIRK